MSKKRLVAWDKQLANIETQVILIDLSTNPTNKNWYLIIKKCKKMDLYNKSKQQDSR